MDQSRYTMERGIDVVFFEQTTRALFNDCILVKLVAGLW